MEARRSALHHDDDGAALEAHPGRVVQLNTVNQFGEQFSSSIREFESAECICGALSLGLALTLSRCEETFTSVASVAARVRFEEESGAVLAATRDAMRYFRDARRRYIDAHATDFVGHVAVRQYVKAWAANYELGDYLASLSPEAFGSGDVAFVRFNQWPERGGATHEEAARLSIDEARFGGLHEGDKATVTLESGASRFIVQDFTLLASSSTSSSDGGAGSEERMRRRRGDLLTLSQWFERRRQRRDEVRRQLSPPPPAPRVFILDLNGHFCAALAIETEGEEDDILCLVNTTDASYIEVPSVAATFDVAFCSG
jgi:hypothetical protein